MTYTIYLPKGPGASAGWRTRNNMTVEERREWWEDTEN